MTTFNYPSSPTSRWQRNPFRRLSALLQGGRIPLRLTGVPGRRSRRPFVAAERDGNAIPRITPLQDALRQGGRQQRDIRRFRAADDEGQRDATPVDQKTFLAPIFFPDPSDSARRPLGLTGLWSTTHQYSARPRQCCASRHTQPVRLATAVRRSPRPAIPKSTDESHWDSQSALWARLSIESRSVRRTRFRRTLVWRVTVFVRPQASVDILDSGRVVAWESTARLSATSYLRLPMIESVVSVSCWTPPTAM